MAQYTARATKGSNDPHRPHDRQRTVEPIQRRPHENVRDVNGKRRLTERHQRIAQPFLSPWPSLRSSKIKSTSNKNAEAAKNGQNQSSGDLLITPDTMACGLLSSPLARPTAKPAKASARATGASCHKKSIPDPDGPLCTTGCSSKMVMMVPSESCGQLPYGPPDSTGSTGCAISVAPRQGLASIKRGAGARHGRQSTRESAVAIPHRGKPRATGGTSHR